MTQTILDVHGIGPAMQTALAKHGFLSVADLTKTTVDKLIITPGISEIKAQQVIADATKLFASDIAHVKSTNKTTKNKSKKTAKKIKQEKIKDKKSKKGKDKKKDKQKAKKSNKNSNKKS